VNFLSYPLRGFLQADWDFLASADQKSCHLPASRWGTTMSVAFQPSYQPTKGFNSNSSKHVLPYKGGSHGGNRPFETPPEGRYLHGVPSRKLDSRHHLTRSLPPVKALKDMF